MGVTDQELEASVAAALETALTLVEEEAAWKVEKEKDGAVVKSRKNGEGRKVWLCIATVPVPADLLWSKLSDTDSVSSWNSTLTESRVIKTVGETNVSYQVTADGGAGLVSARDFVYGNKSVERGGRRVMGGCSVVLDSQPEVSKVVRAVHGPGLQMVEVDGEGCRYTWLMDCDYRGMIPGSVMELAMPHAQLQMIDSIKALV